MDLNIFEYSIICPECKTKTVMVVSDTGLTLFTCGVCKSHIMLYSGRMYPIRDVFYHKILRDYRTEECGSVVFTRKSKKSEDYITNDKIKDLKKTLDNTFFVDDFLKEL